MSNIEAVQGTNDDATMCKMSAVTCGYWNDPYVCNFIKYYERKPPEINRGYYARIAGIRVFINQFIKVTNNKCQIINLGAGFDTLFWNLRNEDNSILNFIEVDFPAVVQRKAYLIRNRKPLFEKLSGNVEITPSAVHSSDYHLISADLRSKDDLENAFIKCDIDYRRPTLIISECVLVYMNFLDSLNLLTWFTSKFSNVLFVNYEQVNMKDRFGSIMIDNLRHRQCDLLGVEHCFSLDTQIKRFIDSGCQEAHALDMNSVYEHLNFKDIHRIESLELLDEREILSQLLNHYCISWACKDLDRFKLSEINFDSCL